MELFHQIYGEGKPLIILHGLFGSSDNWHSLAQRFGSFFQVHCLDLRNHGRSPWNEEHTYDSMATDVAEFVSVHEISTPVVVGHSMGGKVAMRLAQRYPKLIEKLVVADMGIKAYPMHHQHILAGIHALDLSKLRSRSEAENLLCQHIEAPGVRQFLMKNVYWVEKGRLGWRMNVEVLEREMPEILAALPQTICWTPTLFLRGELSNYILPEDEASLENMFPDSTVETLPNAGHWLHAEQQDLFFEAVMGFCLR